MNNLTATRTGIADALSTITGLAVTRSVGAVLDPPCVVVGAMRLEWKVSGYEPTEGVIVVGLAVAHRDDAQEELDEWLIKVVTAIEDHTSNATVKSATENTVPAGGVDLPAYLIEVEVALPWR